MLGKMEKAIGEGMAAVASTTPGVTVEALKLNAFYNAYHEAVAQLAEGGNPFLAHVSDTFLYTRLVELVELLEWWMFGREADEVFRLPQSDIQREQNSDRVRGCPASKERDEGPCCRHRFC